VGRSDGATTGRLGKNMRIELTSGLRTENAGHVDRRTRAGAGLDPKGMRRLLLGLITAIALVVLPGTAQAASKISYQASSEQQVLTLLNQIRAQHKLSPFTASTPLRNAARAHSADMLQNSYFDHNSPTENWDTRIARYLESPMTAENIAQGQGRYGTATGIVNQWMRSVTHRAIILAAGLHQIGLGLAVGTYSGTFGTTMATADFAA
jgi:uncharacterized protein YkwD